MSLCEDDRDERERVSHQGPPSTTPKAASPTREKAKIARTPIADDEVDRQRQVERPVVPLRPLDRSPENTSSALTDTERSVLRGPGKRYCRKCLPPPFRSFCPAPPEARRVPRPGGSVRRLPLIGDLLVDLTQHSPSGGSTQANEYSRLGLPPDPAGDRERRAPGRGGLRPAPTRPRRVAAAHRLPVAADDSAGDERRFVGLLEVYGDERGSATRTSHTATEVAAETGRKLESWLSAPRSASCSGVASLVPPR